MGFLDDLRGKSGKTGLLEKEDLSPTDEGDHERFSHYVDKNKIAIFGWSYGGYMSSLAITKGADVFSLAIAVAPVTNWRYYDNIYTERYMQTPQENASGYDENSPINHVEKLKGHYLLIHGGADDNVHVQNTMEMISALVKANKQFDLFIYPDKNHGIYGGNTGWIDSLMHHKTCARCIVLWQVGDSYLQNGGSAADLLKHNMWYREYVTSKEVFVNGQVIDGLKHEFILMPLTFAIQSEEQGSRKSKIGWELTKNGCHMRCPGL